MTVRAKFTVVGKTENQDGTASITMSPVYDGTPENKEFFKYTPSGLIQLGIMNPPAAAQFVQGKSYYVDFTPTDD